MNIVKLSALKIFNNKAFTLLEIILVLMIITVLASIVIFTLKPADVLNKANDLKIDAINQQFEKAIDLYAAENDGDLPSAFTGLAAGDYLICLDNQTDCSDSSINLDELVEGGYMSSIPVSPGCTSTTSSCLILTYDPTDYSYVITADLNAGTSGTNIYGTGADGAVVIASNKNINTDTIATGRTCADGINYSVTALTTNSATLSTTPAAGCLAANDTVLLINLQGISTNYANVGNYELLTVQSATGTNVTFTTDKTKYYGNGASDDTNLGTATINQRVMLQRVPNYTDVTVNNGVTLTASAWDGTKGGVLAFRANGTTNVTGSISMTAKGYRGGAIAANNNIAQQGEGISSIGLNLTSANQNGGGGAGGLGGNYNEGGGGGGYGTVGVMGKAYGTAGGFTTSAGITTGDSQLNKLNFGGGGGSGSCDDCQSGASTPGSKGGGAIFIKTYTLFVSGNITSKGDVTTNSSSNGGGGSGAGGSTLLYVNSATLGTNLLDNSGGIAGNQSPTCCSPGTAAGGNGGAGRIAISGTATGTTNPTYTLIAAPTPTPTPTPAPTTIPVYGSGADGAVVIASNKNINTDTIATGRTCADGINYSVTALTANSATLSTTPAAGCLAANDTVLLINLQGISTNYANVGNYELLTVQTATGTNVTFTGNKTKYYGNGASDDTNLGTATTNQRVMLQRVPNYTNVTINNGVTLTANAWDGTKGGVLFFRANGTTNVTGIIDMIGKGYRGGNANTGCTSRGFQGESLNGLGTQSNLGNIGGGGASGSAANGGYPCDGRGHGAAGGSYGTLGQNGSNLCTDYSGSCNNIIQTYGNQGSTYGNQTLSKIYLGSGGGSSEPSNNSNKGGGIVSVFSNILTISGNIKTDGNVGVNTTVSTGRSGGAGGASGGSILLDTNTVTLGNNLVSSLGGNGGLGYSDGAGSSGNGGNGGVGRIAIAGTATGTTNPTYNTTSSSGTYAFTSNTVLGTATTYENYDITINTGVTVTMSGTHNFASVTVQSGGIIDVSKFDGTSGSGTLDITANTISIAGTVDGSGRGYGGGGGGGSITYEAHAGNGGNAVGGGGGGGGGGESSGYIGYCGNPGTGGIASQGGGTNGTNGVGGCGPRSAINGNGGNGNLLTNGGVGTYSGGGGGGGLYGGSGGTANNSGGNGGYKSLLGNGDTSTDFTIEIGSGGAGGSGCDGSTLAGANGEGLNGGFGGAGKGANVSAFGGGGAGGGGGGAGGASIKLYGLQSITVTGTIKSNGGIGGTSGAGACTGGGGAGGGIALKGPTVNLTGATIQTKGNKLDGTGSTTNGGTIKVFSTTYSGLTLNTTNFPSGRVYSASI